MRFVVFGGWYGSGNIGDDSILIGLRRVLMQVMPGSEVVAISSDPAQTIRVCGVEAIPLLSPLGRLRRGGASLNAYYETFRGADACIVGGGTPVYDYGYASRLFHFRFPKALGKRLFCFGIGVKPIRSRVGVRLTRGLLRQVDLISIRDCPSRDELVRIGVNRQMSVTGDSALFLAPESYEVGLSKLAVCGVDTERPMVAICPRALSTNHRMHYHEPISGGAISRIRNAVARVADHLSGLGYEVVFIPMHRDPRDDDLEEIRKITGLMRSRAARVVGADLTPGESMAVLGCMTLVFGLRLHSLILAASQGVPVVGVDYDRKIRGFMELAGVGDFICRPSDPSSVFFEKVGKGLGESDALGDRLLRSCDDMKRRILGEAKRLATALGYVTSP